MNKVNKGKKENFRNVGFFGKSLIVVAFLLAGVFLLAGCGDKKGNVLFDSESELTAESSEQKQEQPSQETEENAAKEEEGEQPQTLETDSASEVCYVYVCGAIASPGVYEVEADTRVCEVIQYAGGLTSEAETTCINQALAVYDGQMLVIPTATQWENGEFSLDENGFPVQVPKTEETAEETSEPVADDGKVNINEATGEQLWTLPGVGTSRAESIIAYRQEHGAFETIEDIKKVSGIKDGLFEKIKEKIKV